LPDQYAPVLGIDLAADCLEHSGGGVSGESDRYLYPPGVEAIVFGKKMRLAGCFAPGCSQLLLGRADFFRYFLATFNQQKQSFELESAEDWDLATKDSESAIAEYVQAVKDYQALQAQIAGQVP
jgi:hypothetical protein